MFYNVVTGGGGPKLFFGVWNFGQKEYFGPKKDTRIFLGHEKNTQGFFGFCILSYKPNLLLVWDFFGYTKSRDFLG